MSITDKLITVADNTPAVAESVNAAKATVSGAAIRVDDVLDTEHPLQVQVSSKNLFDISLFRTNNGTYNNGDGTLTVEGYGRATVNSLRSVCPLLKVGDTVTFSFITDGAINGIYLAGYNKAWNNGQSLSITETILDSFLTFYCKRENGVNSPATVSNIQFELGTTATAYMPYNADLTNTEVKVYGKNLIPLDSINITQTINGITFTNNGDGTFTLNGTATAEAIYGFVAAQNAFPIYKGRTYTLSGGINKTIYVQGKYVEDDSFYVFSYGSGGTFTPDNDYSFRANIRVSAGIVCENVTVTPQLEEGATVTDYEPYKEHQTASADSNGKVVGLHSVSPTMTLFAGNGETVECTYFPQAAADTHAKHQELKQAEIALKELITNG